MGAIIVIGFFSMMFFERTKIPDVLFLMLLGVLLGPIFGIIDTSGTSMILKLAPFVGTLALIILLFDGGISLNIFKVVKELGKATSYTLLVFIVTVAAVGFAMKLLFGWQLAEGLLLGAVIGGASSAIVIPILSGISVRDETKTLLTLESAMTDALSIILAFLLIEIIVSNSVNLSQVGSQIASAFSIAFFMAILLAVVWIVLLQKLYGKPFGYLLTIAILFILYSIVESLGGNGAIAVLVFGILLSSMQELTKFLKIPGDFGLEDKLREFQIEVSFFVRTFFFVYMGLIISLPNVNLPVIFASAVLLVIMLASRFVGIRLLNRNFPDKHQNLLIISMLPRGLASAVLAFLPMQFGIGLPYFTELVFLSMVLTNLAATAGVYFYGTSQPSARPRVVEPTGQKYPYSKKR